MPQNRKNMSCFLLTWSPDNWPTEEFDSYTLNYEDQEFLPWKCGNRTKGIVNGDSVFLVKQGKKGKGIIGFGIAVSEPYKEYAFNSELAVKNEAFNFIKVKFEYISLSNKPIPLTYSELLENGVPAMLMNTRSAGIQIKEDEQAIIQNLWHERIGLKEQTYAEEITNPELVKEGAKQAIVVNRYERSQKARNKCIEKWGMNCTVCNFHFEMTYGQIGKGFIHVHHLLPLEDIGQQYELDPVNDLRPVCPNCHAMLHKEKPPLSIECLKAKFKQYAK